jgi:hypothetical protein
MEHQETVDKLTGELARNARKIAPRFGNKHGRSLLKTVRNQGAIFTVIDTCMRGKSGIFRMLEKKNALEMTVEAIAIREEFAPILPQGIRETAMERLISCGYTGALAPS